MRGFTTQRVVVIALIVWLAATASAVAQEFDLLLRGGHVVDPRNGLNAVRDVAIKDGRIARVAPGIQSTGVLKTIDVSGLYVLPGLIDMHAHVYRPTAGQDFGADNNAVFPDGFS